MPASCPRQQGRLEHVTFSRPDGRGCNEKLVSSQKSQAPPLVEAARGAARPRPQNRGGGAIRVTNRRGATKGKKKHRRRKRARPRSKRGRGPDPGAGTSPPP